MSNVPSANCHCSGTSAINEPMKFVRAASTPQVSAPNGVTPGQADSENRKQPTQVRKIVVDPREVRRLWRDWVAKNLGGSEARIEAVTDAAMLVVSQRKNRDEVVRAAYQAAAAWRPYVGSTAANADSGSGPIRGRVAGMQWRQQPVRSGRRYVMLTIWNFWVTRTGPDGKPVAPVLVEMRGFRFKGSIGNGHEVEIDATHFKPGEIIRTREVKNLTTNSIVRAQMWPPSRILVTVLGLIVFFIFVFSAFTSVNKIPHVLRLPHPPPILPSHTVQPRPRLPIKQVPSPSHK